MPVAPLGEVYVKCRFCEHVQAAPPPPAHAWIAQHQKVVGQHLGQNGPWIRFANKFNSLAIMGYVLFVGGLIVVGIIMAIVQAIRGN